MNQIESFITDNGLMIIVLPTLLLFSFMTIRIVMGRLTSSGKQKDANKNNGDDGVIWKA